MGLVLLLVALVFATIGTTAAVCVLLLCDREERVSDAWLKVQAESDMRFDDARRQP